MTIAAFDPGRNLGILRAPAREKAAIVHDHTLYTRKLRDTTDLGAFLRSADAHIHEALIGATECAIERPNTQGQNHSGIVKNVALAGHIAYLATCKGVAVEWVNVSAVKLILTDSGNAKKEQVIPAAELWLGLPGGTLTEHEADALGVWLVRCYGVPEGRAAREKAASARRRAEKEAAKQKGPLL
jgi:Holliday junction resolvasome RuvABC endonuclease subunit